MKKQIQNTILEKKQEIFRLVDESISYWKSQKIQNVLLIMKMDNERINLLERFFS